MLGKYNSWGFYNDASDPRFIVPKINPAMGWTLNIAHRRARVALILMVAILAAGMVGSVLLG